MTEDEIAQRMPIWMALSELFLDTELCTADYRRIRGVLAASAHDSTSLQAILNREVAPALGWNLLSVAGEWAFWTEEDLRDLIAPRLNRHRSPSRSWVITLMLGRYLDRQWTLVDPDRCVGAK